MTKPQTKAPSCERCGAPLPLDLLKPVLRCRHCGADVAVDETLRVRMRTYVGDAVEAVRAEMKARWLGTFYAQNERATRLILGGAVSWALAVTALLFTLGLHEMPLGFLLALAGLWWGSLWAFARGWVVMNAVPTPAQLGSVRVARCEACGAASSFSVAEASVCCKHCNSTLMVPSELASSLLSETREQAVRSSASESEALQRATNAGDRLVTPLVFVVLLAVPGAMAAVFFLSDRAGPDVTVWALYALCLLTAVVEGYRMVRASRATLRARRAMEDSVDQLAARLR